MAVLGVYLYLFRTNTGRLVRAVMQNRSMADCLGVRTDRVDAFTFAIGTGLAGLAGAALCLIGPVGPFIGTDYIVQAFMVVVLGGVGQLLGTVLAAGTVGSLNSIFNLQFSVSIGQVIVFAAVIAFLQFRPSGFVRTRTR
jgi:urea transport system permease protein